MANDALNPRRRETRLRFIAALLFLATLTALVLAGINFGQRARTVPLIDGVAWDQTPEGVLARMVLLDSPASRARIRAFDVLVSINGELIRDPNDVTRILFLTGPGTELAYELQRRSRVFTVSLLPEAVYDPFEVQGFLEFIGVLSLGIGLFALLKRWMAPHALHFYLFCLTSFILYTFSYTGKLNNFDWTIYWTDSVALLLQPALFLHFALSFPESQQWFRKRPWNFALLYTPAALLLAFRIRILAIGDQGVPPSIELIELLDRIEYIHLVVLFLLAAGVFEYTYRTTREPVLVQQMKWVTRGTWMAILPFTAFYVLPLLLDQPPTDWMKLTTLSLAFIPLTFGYAIIRYRLMDVDVIFRRGVAYTLATAVVAALYFGVAVAVAELFHTNLSFGSGGVVIAIIIAAILFPPVKDWTQLQLERLFYRERFDYRQTLEEFARELASEVDLERLLARLLDRLHRTLPVNRMAIFLIEDEETGRYRLARGLGAFPLDLRTNLSALAEAAGSGYVFLDSGQPLSGLTAEDRQALEELGLHYFIPCRVQNRTNGFLGLGKTLDGSFLTSEDIELVQILANYLAVALENARLYRDLELKAEQVERLKDFNENILESSSVGLVALSEDEQIESWNSSMERLTGVPRGQSLNRSVREVFPEDLVEQIEARRTDVQVSSLYKFELRRKDRPPVITNISLAPLVSKDGKPIGRLLVFDDITERVQMEQQLVQNEKLSSLGLLAAGVAHEVNTPLAVISNYAQMLAKQFPAGDKRTATVEKIIKQTFRASEIISGLLNFSRTGPAEFQSVDLNRALRETLSLLQPQLRTARVEVKQELAEDLPSIYGDFGKLQQVFLNLLLNARDAMPQGGRVTLRSHRREQRVHIEINDTGAGIPPESLNKVFDPFFTTKATGQGTGLGLAVTYGIIQEHHGTIQVSSRPGEGTTFSLEFPVLDAVLTGQGIAHA